MVRPQGASWDALQHDLLCTKVLLGGAHLIEIVEEPFTDEQGGLSRIKAAASQHIFQ